MILFNSIWFVNKLKKEYEELLEKKIEDIWLDECKEFKKFYNNYIEFVNHKLYQPGGLKYFETMNHFNDSLEQV